jgi:hypothetical protein
MAVRRVASRVSDWNSRNRPAPIQTEVGADRESFLIHCTRAPQGRWTRESEDAYYDELLLGGGVEPRTALGSLCRMLRMRQIMATTNAKRGQSPSVSFTAATLGELKRMRVFRPHRHRWDFEPFGIGIRRSWLESRGARPVNYGDEAVWDRLSDAERPFFQYQTTQLGNRPIDWPVEAEWRHLEDVYRAEVPGGDAFVFVPSMKDAEVVARISRWPVVCVAGGS